MVNSAPKNSPPASGTHGTLPETPEATMENAFTVPMSSAFLGKRRKASNTTVWSWKGTGCDHSVQIWLHRTSICKGCDLYDVFPPWRKGPLSLVSLLCETQALCGNTQGSALWKRLEQADSPRGLAKADCLSWWRPTDGTRAAAGCVPSLTSTQNTADNSQLPWTHYSLFVCSKWCLFLCSLVMRKFKFLEVNTANSLLLLRIGCSCDMERGDEKPQCELFTYKPHTHLLHHYWCFNAKISLDFLNEHWLVTRDLWVRKSR